MQSHSLLTAALCSLCVLAAPQAWGATGTGETTPMIYTVEPAGQAVARSVEAQVEAVREATLSTQVQGAVTHLAVRPGDRVAPGQEVARVDARAAQLTAAASTAQVEAARAAEQVAAKEYARQKQLLDKQYISQAALDRTEAQWRASQAQLQALRAQAAAATTQSGFYVVKAPFAGLVSQVPAAVGDMALPGKPLLMVYDPSAMRVTAWLGLAEASALRGAQGELHLEIPGLSSERVSVPASAAQVLPTVDALSHTVQVRIALPPSVVGAAPGMFARVWLSVPGTGAAATGPLLVPARAVVQRAELTGIYVLDSEARPLLRQIRLGRPAGDMVEVLSGLRPGDRVALNPQAAARGH